MTFIRSVLISLILCKLLASKLILIFITFALAQPIAEVSAFEIDNNIRQFQIERQPADKALVEFAKQMYR